MKAIKLITILLIFIQIPAVAGDKLNMSPSAIKFKLSSGSPKDTAAIYNLIRKGTKYLSSKNTMLDTVKECIDSAVDYILKPININEFIDAVNRVVKKRSERSTQGNENLRILMENLRSALPSRMAIPTADGMEYLNPKDIIRIEADRSYSWFFLQQQLYLRTMQYRMQ